MLPLVIGVTGGIGSGKTTVCKHLEAFYNIPVYYSDDRAKYLMNSNKELKDSIISEFGENSYLDGALNRKYLAEIIFNDKEKLKIMNSMVHPAVEKDFIEWRNIRNESKYVVYESALLLENKPYYIDMICGVTAKESVRIERVKARNNISEEEVRARMNNQPKITGEMVFNHFDYLVVNESNNTKVLEKSIRTLHSKILADIKRIKRISRYLAKLLRHSPEKEGLQMDNKGWVECNQVYEKLDINKRELEFIVKENNKQRFSFDEDKTKIRANQGHSIKVDLGFKKEYPPNVLYHGTSDKFYNSIKSYGIRKMNRTHVHLSDNIETAENVGKRKGGKLTILKIDARKMQKDNIDFYLSENKVWLTDYVDPKYIL
jgi:putative RNA 2'-phosphotransferase